jgi:hypothetical protein
MHPQNNSRNTIPSFIARYVDFAGQPLKSPTVWGLQKISRSRIDGFAIPRYLRNFPLSAPFDAIFQCRIFAVLQYPRPTIDKWKQGWMNQVPYFPVRPGMPIFKPFGDFGFECFDSLLELFFEFRRERTIGFHYVSIVNDNGRQLRGRSRDEGRFVVELVKTVIDELCGQIFMMRRQRFLFPFCRDVWIVYLSVND